MTRAPYYSIIGAAELAGVTEGAIRQAILRGSIQAEQTIDGRARLVPKLQLEAWMKERKRRSKERAAD